MNLKTAYTVDILPSIGGLTMDVETRLQQVATVINQIDDPKSLETFDGSQRSL